MSAAQQFLPPRWEFCPKMGKVIAQKFLPMKAPLCSRFDELLEQDLQFHPEDIFKNTLENSGNSARIGMVVDLTKSYRFYDNKEIVAHGCIYKKISIEGHGQSPTIEQTAAFLRCVKEFFEKNSNDVIAVHCTHGFNRTGFLIIAYLVEECGYALDMAVQEFAAARPDGIYKQGYLDDLCQRYGDSETIKIKAPGRPLWESGPVEDAEIQCGKPVDVRRLNSPEIDSSPKFMDGLVAGVVYVEDKEQRSYLQLKVLEFCSNGGKKFPGSQPVSLEESPQKQNMGLLATLPYMVSWKADGMRYLVLIDGEDQIYAFDRDFNVFHIPKVKFPLRESERSICNTLLDAEMIIERVQNEKGLITSIPRLLIYDLIWFENTNIGREPFWKRFEMVKNELIDPLIEAMKKGKIRREDQLMSIRRKDFYLLEATPKLFEPKFLKSLGHEIDGLVFQPRDLPYIPGPCEQLLKWKPPGQCTIDFKLVIKKLKKEGMLPEEVGNLHVLGTNEPFAKISVTSALRPYNNKIIECHYNPASRSWEFMRERTDKSFPNKYETAFSVMNTIKYPVSKEKLLCYICSLFSKL